jgi:putative copper export protein
VLLAKIGLALVLVAIGGYHRYRVVPRLESDGAASFGISLRIEVALMAAVIIVAGVLSYLSPHGAA